MPGPYCLCNGEMRCKGTLAGRACPAPTARLGDTAPLPPLYTTVTSVSQSPVTAYLPLPAGIK